MYMLTFNTPGIYSLTPDRYQYSEYLIFELWGAGGGCANPCRKNIDICAGGGSGSYLKALVHPNNLTLNISVGLGGLGGSGDFIYYSENDTKSIGQEGTSGEDTWVKSIDNSINLVAGGGYSGDSGGIGGFVKSVEGTSNQLAIDGERFHYMYHPNYQTLCRGGNAPLGGSGGSDYAGTVLHGYYLVNIGRPGKYPGGGGFGFLCTTFSSVKNSTSYCGSGGNGAVNVYFNTLKQSVNTNESINNSGIDKNINMILFVVIFVLQIFTI